MIESVWETRNINSYIIGNSLNVWKYSNKYRLECVEDSAISDIWIYDDFTIEVTYRDQELIRSTNDILESAVQEVLQQCNKATTDIEKELIIHDYLILNGEYDYDNLEHNSLPAQSFSAYGILVNKIGVCQSYAYARKVLLRDRKSVV